MKRNSFSAEDDAFIIEHWNKRRQNEIAMMLLRYPAVIAQRAIKLGLGGQPAEVRDRSQRHNSDYVVFVEQEVRAAANRHGYHYTNDCDIFISENWETMHYSVIAKKLNRTANSVYSRARNTLLLPSQVKK